MAAHRMHLPLHGMDIFNGGKIEIASPNIGLQIGEEFRPRRHIAGNGPRLYVNRTLPILSHALIIAERRIHGDGDRRGAGVRAQTQIDAKNKTVRRHILQKRG